MIASIFGYTLAILYFLWKFALKAGTFLLILLAYMKQGSYVAYQVVIQNETFSRAEEKMEEEFEDDMEELRERYDTHRFARITKTFSRIEEDEEEAF